MGALWLTFAAANALTVAASIKRRDALVAAAAVVGVWAFDSAMVAAGVPVESRRLVNVGMDTLAAIGFVVAWRVIWPPKNWLFALALTFFAQVMAHRVMGDRVDWPAVHVFEVTLNLLYVLQLLTVVIGPRAGQLVGHARSSIAGVFGGPHTRNRRGGVVASLDRSLRSIGGETFRRDGEAP